jgi:phosphopantothenoylcysteine synthetase/decarboxylase
MKVILGVTGSISAYKAVDIFRLFQKEGHEVKVILTKAATRFIPPLTFETFAPGNVYTEMFEQGQDPLLHINIGREGDLLLIAPATANIMGKLANGIADDLLTTAYLAFHGRVVLAPAMNTTMYQNPAVLDNVAKLRSRAVEIVEPEEGSLACQTEGRGRLAAVDVIYRHCMRITHV